MYRVPLGVYSRIMRGESPTPYIMIQTHMGTRVYAEKELGDIFSPAGLLLDGSFILDGSEKLGSENLGIIEKSGRVISFDGFERALQSMKDDVLGSYLSKDLQNISVELDNTDDYFSKLIASEPIIGRSLQYCVGFENEAPSTHLKLFSGVIKEIGVLGTLRIDADEGEAGLSDTFYLKRAALYTEPLDGNSPLPVVYGNLADGVNGIWELPCIDISSRVYCFAGHPVLSVANGNEIAIYADEVLVNPANYTFNASNDYQSQGYIATITFTAEQDNAKITATGKGKVLTGTTLMENIIDIVNDLLTVENTWTSALFESTAKATATQIFTAQGYKAAGVIDKDAAIWEIITQMMGSFLGSAYINGNGNLVLDIDNNTIPQGAADIISKSDAVITDVKIRRDNIINQCPCVYAYNNVDGEFKSQTDSITHASISSQSVFGIRKPAESYQHYWCRDLTSVQNIQDLIVEKLNSPRYEIEIQDTTLKRIGVDIGDHIVYSAEHLYDTDGVPLLNNFWKVTAVRPDYAKNNITFRALQTGLFSTIAQRLDGSWILDGSAKLGGEKDLTTY